MKIVKYRKFYAVHCGQRHYRSVLDVVNVLTHDDMVLIAEETTYKLFKFMVKEALDKHAYKYPLEKVCHILADGVFTRKRDRNIKLSRKGLGFNRRLSRMLSNYALAERLGIECYLKNKLLENENANNQAELLGL